jgi:hypothetical protein
LLSLIRRICSFVHASSLPERLPQLFDLLLELLVDPQVEVSLVCADSITLFLPPGPFTSSLYFFCVNILVHFDFQVRELVGVCLTSLVKRAAGPTPEELTQLFASKLRSSASSASPSQLSAAAPSSQSASSVALRERHGAVVGLAALCAAAPYDIPVVSHSSFTLVDRSTSLPFNKVSLFGQVPLFGFRF